MMGLSGGPKQCHLVIHLHSWQYFSSLRALAAVSVWFLFPHPALFSTLILSRDSTRGVPFMILSPLAIAMIKMTLSCLK